MKIQQDFLLLIILSPIELPKINLYKNGFNFYFKYLFTMIIC